MEKSEKNLEYVYSAYITLPNGKRIYAKWYGLKAFRFPKENKN